MTRQEIFFKYGGLCAYSGTTLNPDHFTVDHIIPRVLFKSCNMTGAGNPNNLVPCHAVINSAKADKTVKEFKAYLSTLHEKLTDIVTVLPENEAKLRQNIFLLKLAHYFGITAVQPFSGKFYFETVCQANEQKKPRKIKRKKRRAA